MHILILPLIHISQQNISPLILLCFWPDAFPSFFSWWFSFFGFFSCLSVLLCPQAPVLRFWFFQISENKKSKFLLQGRRFLRQVFGFFFYRLKGILRFPLTFPHRHVPWKDTFFKWLAKALMRTLFLLLLLYQMIQNRADLSLSCNSICKSVFGCD